VILLLIVSIGFESLFLDHGINAMDEGWPLHAAMEMHDGKTLYDEVFWVFPPGHVLPAWIAYGLEPPGIVGARTIYAAFCVALCLALYFVARRLMPADFALLAGLLVAIAAPRSHSEHLLFGYRYLVWSTLVLLFFRLRLTRDESRWLFVAGIFAGIALFFRLTPAFAVSAAIAVGIVAASRRWQRWLADGLWYGAGLLLVTIPVLLWFHNTVGLERLWIETVVRPIEMTALQSKPIPDWVMPEWRRERISFAFAIFGFRFYWIVYLGFSMALLYQWGRALLSRRPFNYVFLLTFVLFGAINFSRSVGRSDIPHLDSALPPVVVLLAYCASLSTKLPSLRLDEGSRKAVASRWLLCALILGAWSFLNGSDRFLDQDRMMGKMPMVTTMGSTNVRFISHGALLDSLAPLIQSYAEEDDTILVMTIAPLIYVLADRHSPGYRDLVMPGTFRSEEEEQAFVEHVKAEPPAAVVWPRKHFDFMESRGLQSSAPRLSRWIGDHYQVAETNPIYLVLVPK
jgi:hypothetical protein